MMIPALDHGCTPGVMPAVGEPPAAAKPGWVAYRPVSDVTRTVRLPFAGQRLVDEVEAVADPLPAGPGRRGRAGQRRAVGVRLDAALAVGPGQRAQPHDEQRADEQADDPAAHGAELGPLGPQQLREPVPPGDALRPVGRDAPS